MEQRIAKQLAVYRSSYLDRQQRLCTISRASTVHGKSLSCTSFCYCASNRGKTFWSSWTRRDTQA